MFIVATLTSDEDEFRSNFLTKTSPWYGSIYNPISGTRIDFVRMGLNDSELTFRSQGELLASLREKDEENTLLQIYAPSLDVDMIRFYQEMKEVYYRYPEIFVFLREAFAETPEDLSNLAQTPGDRAVMVSLFQVSESIESAENHDSETDWLKKVLNTLTEDPLDKFSEDSRNKAFHLVEGKSPQEQNEFQEYFQWSNENLDQATNPKPKENDTQK